MEQSKKIETEWGNNDFAPVAEHLRRAVDIIRNASLEKRFLIKQTIHTILTKGEIEELKHFVEQLNKDEATE